VKLVHLVGFIIKKFVTVHGHTNLKYYVEYTVALGYYVIEGTE